MLKVIGQTSCCWDFTFLGVVELASHSKVTNVDKKKKGGLHPATFPELCRKVRPCSRPEWQSRRRRWWRLRKRTWCRRTWTRPSSRCRRSSNLSGKKRVNEEASLAWRKPWFLSIWQEFATSSEGNNLVFAQSLGQRIGQYGRPIGLIIFSWPQ